MMVCLGNICRSPAAEAVLRKMAGSAGKSVQIESSGTSGWHQGEPAYGPMIKAAALRSYDLRAGRAQAFKPADFARFNLILALDRSVLADLEALRPENAAAELRLFRAAGDVPDPYYTRDFDQALDLIEAGCRDLLAQL